MNLTQKLLGVASIGIAFASLAVAQTATTTTTAASLLGVQYVEAGLGYQDVNHANRGIYSLGAAVNTPISTNVDFTASYSHDWLENNDSFYRNVLGGEVTAYLTKGNLRPFVGAGVGYIWEGSGDDNYAIWNANVGAEYSLNSTTALTATVGYSDSFENRGEGAFGSSLVVSHWFTSKIAGTAGVSWIEGGNVGYGVSAIFKF